LFGACGVKYIEDTFGELPSRLVSDDLVSIVNASEQTMHLVVTTLEIHEWPEHVSDYYAINYIHFISWRVIERDSHQKAPHSLPVTNASFRLTFWHWSSTFKI
jgi:hypothetical protein